MRISTDDRVGVDDTLRVFEDTTSKILEVDLVDNAGARGDNAEVLESILTPLEELESLFVVVELLFLILLKRVSALSEVDLEKSTR